MTRELSSHELAVRRAVEKTERQGKLSAARFKVERAKARLKKLDDERGKLRGEVEEAEADLAAIEKLMKEPLVPQDVPPPAPDLTTPIPAVADPLK